MTIQTIRAALQPYAKDIKINLGNVVSDEALDGLTLSQSYAIALAAAYAIKHPKLVEAVTEQVQDTLSDTEIEAAKAAATVMAMNNIYYRFVHLVSDKEYAAMPAGLRMNVMASPGVDKVTFELMSLAVSAIAGCGMCIDAHTTALQKAEVSKAGIQSAIRIAAVLNAAAQALDIG